MTEEIAKQLRTDVPKEYISRRSNLDYISGRYVKQRLNEVFGWDGWSYEIQESKLQHLDEEAVRWYVHVRLRVGQVTRDAIAIGHGTMKDRYGKPLSVGRMNEVVDFAAAEAVTDAIKRAAVSLGQNFGLSLYPMVDKDKRDPKAHKSKSEPAELEPPPPFENDLDEVQEKPKQASEQDQVRRFAISIAECSSLSGLKMLGETIKKSHLSEASVDDLRRLFAMRAKELGG